MYIWCGLSHVVCECECPVLCIVTAIACRPQPDWPNIGHAFGKPSALSLALSISHYTICCLSVAFYLPAFFVFLSYFVQIFFVFDNTSTKIKENK